MLQIRYTPSMFVLCSAAFSLVEAMTGYLSVQMGIELDVQGCG